MSTILPGRFLLVKVKFSRLENFGHADELNKDGGYCDRGSGVVEIRISRALRGRGPRMPGEANEGPGGPDLQPPPRGGRSGQRAGAGDGFPDRGRSTRPNPPKRRFRVETGSPISYLRKLPSNWITEIFEKVAHGDESLYQRSRYLWTISR